MCTFHVLCVAVLFQDDFDSILADNGLKDFGDQLAMAFHQVSENTDNLGQVLYALLWGIFLWLKILVCRIFVLKFWSLTFLLSTSVADLGGVHRDLHNHNYISRVRKRTHTVLN